MWLAYFIWHNILKVHPHCTMCQNFLPFQGWVIFHCIYYYYYYYSIACMIFVYWSWILCLLEFIYSTHSSILAWEIPWTEEVDIVHQTQLSDYTNIFTWISWDFLCIRSCHVWAERVLPLPFQHEYLLFLFLASLLWVQSVVWCWMAASLVAQ